MDKNPPPILASPCKLYFGQWSFQSHFICCCRCCCCSVVSSSLQLHGLQHARLPCLSLSPRVFSNSCLLSRWGYITISSSAALFFFCLQFFPASRAFPISYLFIYLCVLGLSGSMSTLIWGMWDLVPCPGIEPGLPAMVTWSLSHCASREVPQWVILTTPPPKEMMMPGILRRF